MVSSSFARLLLLPVLLVAGLVVLPGTTPVASAAAVSCDPPDCYIAATVNLKTGYAYTYFNAPSERKARHLAMQRCEFASAEADEDGCTRAGVARNGCIAVAYRKVDGDFKDWASASKRHTRRHTTRQTKRIAIRRAKAKLEGPGTRFTWVAGCTAG